MKLRELTATLVVLAMTGPQTLEAIAATSAAEQATAPAAKETAVSTLFLANTGRFYARVPLPERRRERLSIVAALHDQLDSFAAELFRDAAQNADRASHPLVDGSDAQRAVARLLPQQIDLAEDVHFFPQLAPGEQVALEGYDVASFRDSGIHLGSLQRGLDQTSGDTPLPNSFATTILSHAIAQYGVLLLRLAGEKAVRDTDQVRLTPGDLTHAAEQIRARAARPPRGSPLQEEESTKPETFFSDITDSTAVRFVHRSSKWLGEFRHTVTTTPPTFSGGGVAAEDINGDSHIDLLFVGGFTNALLLGDGRGHFTDVTEQAGLVWSRSDGSRGEARQPIIADFDNDGRQDILITYANDEHHLYRNLDNTHFVDVSSTAGLGGAGLIGGPVTVFDYDNDGLLDIYLAQNGNYLDHVAPTPGRDNRNALPNRLFRNRGGMRFEDVTKGSGAADTGWAQAVSHADFDRDGRQDIIVANDFGRNALLQNLGNGKFKNVAAALGLDQVNHSMNVGITDFNGDGYPDFYISNLATLMKGGRYIFPDINLPSEFDSSVLADMTVKESDLLYLSRANQGHLIAYEPSESIARGPTSTGWAWDAEFFDFDHDGDDDLYLVNGKSDYNTNPLVYEQPGEDHRITRFLLNHNQESNVFYRNDEGVLKNTSARSGADFTGNSRSTAYLDIDNDGDLDIAINNFHAPAVILRNNAERYELNWLKIRLIGDPKQGSNRDAIGARILVTAGEQLRVSREIHGGSGYLSMNPKQQHFGLGHATSVDVRITWPNGEQSRLAGISANRSYTVRQGVGVVSKPIE